MTYAVIDPASVGRAARDMTRLSKEIIELTIEAANGLAPPGTAFASSRPPCSSRTLPTVRQSM